MLFFELYPAFMALVCLVAGVWLFVMNLEARSHPEDPASERKATGPGDANKVAAIGLIAILLGAHSATAQVRAPGGHSGAPASHRIEQRVAPSDARALALSDALEATVDAVSPSVVQIFTTAYRASEGLAAHPANLITTERASGSGVIVDPSGYIVTNAHVVSGAHRVLIEIPGPAGGRSILGVRGRTLAGDVVGMDRETDLAVIKVDGRQLPALSFADSDDLRAGQLVMAFGSPLGLTNSVSLGIVSAVARQLETESPMIYVQTDASINQGSSGGPLVDVHGRIVGINTLIVSQAGGDEGLGFAAPSNIVRTVYEQIRSHGRVRRGDIGVRAQTITPVLAAGLKFPRDRGVVLADVLPGSPAARAGLRPGDLALTLNGKPMENGRQLQVGLYRHFVGDVVSFEILRDGLPATIAVTMLERRDSLGGMPGAIDPREHLVPRLGILGVTLNAGIADALPALRLSSGVVVVSTVDGAIDSREGGLDQGDIVYAVNRTPVAGLAELRATLNAMSSGDPVVLHIERQGMLMYLTFTID